MMIIRIEKTTPGADAGGGGQVRLGLIHEGQLYDVSQTEAGWAGSVRSLLTTDQSVASIWADLEEMPDRLDPVAPAEALLATGQVDAGSTRYRLLAPVDQQEVWAAGVTYKRSEEARKAESEGAAAFYGLVYEAERPELFFKATPHRTVGSHQAVGIRQDAAWNVPEAELGLVLTSSLDVLGFTIGNDMSSRDIEGENPLYLPQAKVYTAACAVGPGIVPVPAVGDQDDLAILLRIRRGEDVVFIDETSTAQMKRTLNDLVAYLGRSNTFPDGVILLTGTGIVPDDDFTLEEGDVIDIEITGLGTLTNPVMTVA